MVDNQERIHLEGLKSFAYTSAFIAKLDKQDKMREESCEGRSERFEMKSNGFDGDERDEISD